MVELAVVTDSVISCLCHCQFYHMALHFHFLTTYGPLTLRSYLWLTSLNIVTQEEAECSLGVCSRVHNRLIAVKARLKFLTCWNCCYATVRSRDIRKTDIAMAKMIKWIKTDYSMYAPFAKHTYLIKGQAPYKR